MASGYCLEHRPGTLGALQTVDAPCDLTVIGCHRGTISRRTSQSGHRHRLMGPSLRFSISTPRSSVRRCRRSASECALTAASSQVPLFYLDRSTRVLRTSLARFARRNLWCRKMCPRSFTCSMAAEYPSVRLAVAPERLRSNAGSPRFNPPISQLRSRTVSPTTCCVQCHQVSSGVTGTVRL